MPPLKVLVETADPALAISDFRFLVDAGFEVARCRGPGDNPTRCPLLRGERCRLVDDADVVLHELEPGMGIDAAIRASRPDVPMVVHRRRGPDGTAVAEIPAGSTVVVFPCSVDAQLDAVEHPARR